MSEQREEKVEVWLEDELLRAAEELGLQVNAIVEDGLREVLLKAQDPAWAAANRWAFEGPDDVSETSGT